MSESENSTRLKSSFFEKLNAILGLRRSEEDEFRDQPQQKGVTIALCITCSILLWVFSSMSETYTKMLEVETQVANLADDEAFLTLPPKNVEVYVQGEGLALLQLFYTPPSISIDASRSQVNFIEAISRRLPSGISVDRVTPPMFILQKEKRMSRRVPIILNADIQTPPTHDLVLEPTIFPDSVEISGAESLVENVNEWPTVFFEHKELKDTLTVEIPLVDSLQGLVQVAVSQTQLHVIAEQFTEASREIEVIIGDGPNQTSITLDPPALEVRYRVPLSQYRRAQNARDFILSVSYDDIRDDTTGYVEPRLELPQGILFRDVSFFPEEIRYFDVLLDE